MMTSEAYLAECETCGTVVRRITDPALIARIAANPYAYMVWCWSCAQEIAEMEGRP